MADHPLRPATDRRLGEPLPHQLANQTRAHPKAINLSPCGLIRYYSKFPWAIPYLRVGSHALLTRLPLPRRGVRLACVRPAASVRSEPGSNSQVESLDSGRLGGITPRIFCVTGTFTLIHSDFSACIMVMAETQLSPESVLDHEPIFQSSGSARTPPSAFPFLQNHLSKSKTATKTAHRSQSDRL